jgi:hypothetical protein
MVVFVDLDGDDEEAPEDGRRVNFILANRLRKLRVVEDKAEPEIQHSTRDDGQLVNANRGSFAAALACYPYVAKLQPRSIISSTPLPPWTPPRLRVEGADY